MITSKFVLQVAHADTGLIVEWAPGQQVERDLIEEIANRVIAKGVGIARTSTHVKEDVKAAIAELFFDLKAQVPPR